MLNVLVTCSLATWILKLKIDNLNFVHLIFLVCFYVRTHCIGIKNTKIEILMLKTRMLFVYIVCYLI